MITKIIYFSLLSDTIRLAGTSVCGVMWTFLWYGYIDPYTHGCFRQHPTFSWKKRKKRIFLKKEAKKRNFKRKEEKEGKEAEWDARLTSSNRHFARLWMCFSNNFELWSIIGICIQENITSFNFIFQVFEHTLIE